VRCAHEHREGENVHLLARPLPAEQARVAKSPTRERSHNTANTVEGIVTDVIFHQERFKVTLDHGLYVYLQEVPRVGETVEVGVKVECLA
jgi:hypothetical protein